MKNKKAVSEIFITIIILLLVLIAIAVVWGVVSKLIGEGAEQVNLGAKCLNTNIQIIKVINTSATDYDVTLSRRASGEEVDGIKLVFFNDVENSEVMEFGQALAPLETKTASIDTGISRVNKIEYTAYFLDESKKEQICSQTSSYEF